MAHITTRSSLHTTQPACSDLSFYLKPVPNQFWVVSLMCRTHFRPPCFRVTQNDGPHISKPYKMQTPASLFMHAFQRCNQNGSVGHAFFIKSIAHISFEQMRQTYLNKCGRHMCRVYFDVLLIYTSAQHKQTMVPFRQIHVPDPQFLNIDVMFCNKSHMYLFDVWVAYILFKWFPNVVFQLYSNYL